MASSASELARSNAATNAAAQWGRGISGYCGQILHLPQNHIGQQVIRLDLQAVLIHYTGKVVVPDVGDEGPSRRHPYCAVTGQYKPNVYLHAENDAESTGQPNRCPPPGHPR